MIDKANNELSANNEKPIMLTILYYDTNIDSRLKEE